MSFKKLVKKETLPRTDEYIESVIYPHDHSTDAEGKVAHSDTTGLTTDNHHPQIHAAEHEIGGGDLLTHDNITGITTDNHHPQIHDLSSHSDLDAGSEKITSVADPTADQDAATKKYTDDANAAQTLQTITDAGATTTNPITIPKLNTTITAGAEKTYDYSNITSPSSFQKAYQKTDATLSVIKSDPTTWSGTEANTLEYGQLWTQDNNGYQSHNGSTAIYLGLLCEIELGETAEEISALEIFTNTQSTSITGYHYIWNYTTSAWDNLGTIAASTTLYREATYNITSDIEDYVQGKKIWFLTNTESVRTPLHALRLDYISITPTLAASTSSLEDNEWDNDYTITRTSPNALVVAKTDGTRILSVNTSTGATEIITASVASDMIVGGQAWFQAANIGMGNGYIYSFSVGGAPNTTDNVRLVTEYEGIGSSNAYFTQKAVNPDATNTTAHFGYNMQLIPKGTTNWGAGSEVIAGRRQVSTEFNVSTGSSLLDVYGGQDYGAYLLGNLSCKDLFATYSSPFLVAAGTLTAAGTAYGHYIHKGVGSMTGDLVLQNIELPTGGTNNYQKVLEGNGAGSGVWFNGKTGERLYSDGTNLKTNCIFNPTGYKSSDGSNGITATITTAKLTSGGSNGSMTFKNGLLTDQTAAT